MPMGPGKYDDMCTLVRERLNITESGGVLLIVLGTEEGPGFSVQADLNTLMQIPDVLEEIARQVREDMQVQ